MHQLGMEPAERFHHHPGIHFEDLPGVTDADHVDRSEADADRLRGTDRKLNAGATDISLVQQDRLRTQIEIMAPVQDAALARGQDRVEIGAVRDAVRAQPDPCSAGAAPGASSRSERLPSPVTDGRCLL